MKTALLLLLLALSCSVCNAQGTNEKRDDGICDQDACMDAKFKYRFCTNDGRVVEKCSDDPNNEPGMKLLKRKIPIEYSYEWWSLDPQVTRGDDTISFYEGDLLEVREYPMFVGQNMRPIVQVAAQRWMTNLCPQQGPDDEYQNCLVRIRWSTGSDNLGEAFARTNYDIVQGCSVYCGSVEIILNQNPNFTLLDEYERPRFFIATERQNYAHLPQFPPGKYIYMDAYTLMLHEFGHWLGFPHVEGTDSYGESCGDPNGIMKAVAGNLEQGELTWTDECMFLKAYCCEDSQRKDITGDPRDPRDPNDPPINNTKTVIARTPEEGFAVLPNPSRSGMLMLRLTLPEESGSGSVRLVDGAGRVVLDQQLVSAKGQEVVLDASALPKGMYMVQVFFGDRAFSRKVVIE